ncbi:Sec1-like protein [Dactylonectria macrodidyma]|uniref:Sec1-like protein n=1 Tax=Dactylonectria macrodidyma TaxID=307937 RepID=A0A9P9FPA2_9HYPO|nr:Sec1-like protein [Dactylonectria macrodidyma]
MAPRTEFNTEQIRNKARKDLLYLLEGVRGKKNVVLDRSLVGPIGIIVKVAVLQEYGVDKFFILENNNVDTSQRNVIFIARGECGRQAEAIAAQIKRVQRESQTPHDFHIFWVPRRTLVSDQMLEEAGVLGDVNISELPLSFFPLEKDLLSLELDDSFRDLYLSKDVTPNFLLARALMEIQQDHGLFPKVIGKGDNAKRVADLLGRMRQELLAGEDANESDKVGLTPSTTNESVIIIDREVDFVTPLLTQLTYEGLIDEVFEIQNNQTKVDTAVVGASAQSSAATAQSRKRTIQLDSSDKLYDQLRDANFAIVGSLLNKVARRLQKVQSDYESKHKTKTIAELKDFVSQLPGYQQEQQSARIHTGLAEEIIKHTRTDLFKGLLEVQQNLAAGAEPSSQFEGIEELIARDAPIRETLRLLCIYSCISGGIKPKDFDQFRRLILEGYGYQHLLTLNNLGKLQLFLSRSSPLAGMIPMAGNADPNGTKTNYTYLRKQLRLIVDEVQEDDPNDISYVYSGYAPLSIRLVQCILQKQYLLSVTKGGGAAAAGAPAGTGTQGWHGFDEAVKHVRGQTFYEHQKGEDKAVKARALLSGNGNKQTVFVVFVGGITFTEIAALRFIAKQEEGRRNIVICTTSIISGNRMMDAAIEKESFAKQNSATGTELGRKALGGKETFDSLSLRTTIVKPHARARMSPPTTPDMASSSQSQQTSTEHTPDIAPEIVVWSGDMEIDVASPHESDDSMSDLVNVAQETIQVNNATQPHATATDDAVGSFTSSLSALTELSDLSSAPSTAEGSGNRPILGPPPARLAQSPLHTGTERYNFNILPNECISAAESSRLNPYALHAEEYHLLRHHISHIQSPWVGVTRREAVGCAHARWFDAASVCYDWLARRGYINYGCSVPIIKRQKTIVGLFKQYADRFYERGEEPPRGRVYSREFKTKTAEPKSAFVGKRHTAEMGGMIITGFDRGNPINILLRGQLSLPYHPLTADTTIYDINGKPVDPARDQLVEKLYNDCLDRVSEYKHKFPPSKLIEGNRDGSKTMLQAEDAAAALPHAPPVTEQISSDKLTGRVHNEPGTPATSRAPEKAKWMGWTLRGKSAEDKNIDLTQAVNEDGATLGSVLDSAISQYKQLVDLNAQDYRLINWHIANLDLGFHTMVVGGYQSVARGEDSLGSATIECDDGSVVDADAVVCTIPLGVLKHNNTDVIELYDKVFWDPDRDIFGQDYSVSRGRFFQWFNVSNTTGLPCLIALLAGDAGLIAEATEVLRTVVTRWGSDRFARGSYSSAAPGMQPEDYDVMARPVGNLFFAGEHTIGTHPATILSTMIGPIEVPTPLILPRDSLLLRKPRIEAYELERPVRPGKVASNAYLLYSKALFDVARKRCEENRKPGRGGRAVPNEVRVMTSKMWKEASPEERYPFECQAAEQKRSHVEAMHAFKQAAEKWDHEAMVLQTAYEKEHPSIARPGELVGITRSAQKSRRTRNISYAEDGDSDIEV